MGAFRVQFCVRDKDRARNARWQCRAGQLGTSACTQWRVSGASDGHLHCFFKWLYQDVPVLLRRSNPFWLLSPYDLSHVSNFGRDEVTPR